jgi:hypothetical protein
MIFHRLRYGFFIAFFAFFLFKNIFFTFFQVFSINIMRINAHLPGGTTALRAIIAISVGVRIRTR